MLGRKLVLKFTPSYWLFWFDWKNLLWETARRCDNSRTVNIKQNSRAFYTLTKFDSCSLNEICSKNAGSKGCFTIPIRTFEKFRARRGRQPNQFEFNAKIALEKGKNEQNRLNSTQSNGNLLTKCRKALCTECYIFNVHLPSPNGLKKRELKIWARALVAHSFTFNFDCPD